MEFPENWDEIRRQVIKKNKFTCFRCDEVFQALNKLTVHHVIPRSEGGTNDESNLVPLCYACHDYVEIAGYRSKVEILGSYESPYVETLKIKDNHRIDNFPRPAWHAWVYGGQRNPICNSTACVR